MNVKKILRKKGVNAKNTKKLLRFASQITERIPKKGDTTLQVALKVMSIIDVAENLREGKKTELPEIVERLDLASKTNGVFPSMFFGTKLHEDFRLDRYSVDGMYVVEAISKEHGNLLFVEKYDKRYEATFYHSRSFDFDKVLQRTWDIYGGRVHFEIYWDRHAFSSFSTIPNPLYGRDAERMEEIVARHRKFQLDGRTRAYMFYGPPGTGKTSFALAFAERVGSRVMRVDAKSFSMVSVTDIIFIIDALEPDFIMIDDIDKADVSVSLPTILGILSEIKQHTKNTSLLLTANTIDRFDHGLLRPGRIDTWVSVDKPDELQRREIIMGYLKNEQLSIDSDVVTNLVSLTDGLTQDYLREVAECLKYDDPCDVVSTITLMRKLLGRPSAVTKPNGKANGTTSAEKA